jgi:folate-binding protein YgfZ
LQPGYGKKLQEHLATFLMFANVNLEDASQHWGHLALLGPQVGSLLQELLGLKVESEPGTLRSLDFEGETLLLFPSSRLGLAGWEILLTPEKIKSFANHLMKMATSHGLAEIKNEVLEMIRVEAGLPKIGVDMGPDNLVAEVGLDKSATSFNKGCYLGQETTARVQSRGHVNRKLLQLKPVGAISESLLPLPLEIFQGEKSVGHLTSLVHSLKWKMLLGLGIVQLQALESGEKIYLKTSKGPIELQKI